MTTQKSFKRRIRGRMQKTGERYTAARRQLVEKAGRSAAPNTDEPSERPHDPTPNAVTRLTSDDAVRNATGRSWDEWFAILDDWSATEKRHPEIARWLVSEHGVDGWWAQSVTVSYERARGMRRVHERADGFFATASKTVAVPVERLFDAFVDESARAAWLPDPDLRLRGASRPKSIRFEWAGDGSRVTVGFLAKGDAKSQVGLEHARLRDAESAERLKAYWRARMAVLKATLEA